MPLGKLVEHGRRDLLPRSLCILRHPLPFEEFLVITDVLKYLHPSGVAAMALRYSQTSNMSLDVQEMDS